MRRRFYLDAASGLSGNPSSPTQEGRFASTQLETAREKIARTIEVKNDDIIFTSGATESNALALLGMTHAARRSVSHPHVLFLPSAHASITENIAELEREGVSVEALHIVHGAVDTEALMKQLRDETVLIAMDAVCGETGVVWNTRQVMQAVRTRYVAVERRPFLHVDASQAVFSERITRAHFDADSLTFDAAKVMPLRGAGVLAVRRTIPLAPLYYGGGQERGKRPGSEAVQLMGLFAEALQKSAADRASFRKHSELFRTQFLNRVTAAIPRMMVNEGPQNAPQIVNLSFPGRDTDYLVALLDEKGFAVSTRSACETDSTDGSRAVYALFKDEDRARSTLRISWGPGMSMRALSRFATALIDAVAFVDSTVRA